ncbi:MAG: FecR family protein [Bacteroidales bacterium]|nr:MAG: FecR family protein [Bacteroidales bacterium]
MDINVIITRFLSGETNRQETQVLQEWLSQSLSNRKYFKEIDRVYHATEIIGNPDNINPEEVWEAIKNKLSEKTGISKEQALRVKSIRKIQIYRKLVVAATFLLIIGLSFTGAYLYFLNKTKTLTAYNEIRVPTGSKSSITLSDGSKLWLNSLTNLKYPEKFGPTLREVYLEGEAYFEIAKDKDKPFYVRTSDLDIKVLGTTFNVKSYADEGTIETTLESGSLYISKKAEGKKTNQVILKPNQRLTFIKSEGRILVDDIKDKLKGTKENKKTTDKTGQRLEKLYLSKNIDTKLYTSWKDNRLVFVDESFESLAVKMERWYNVKIIIKGDKLKQFRFTGTFENETIEQALKALQITTRFEFTFDQNIITIQYY